jgi:multidrug resistance efflux pump
MMLWKMRFAIGGGILVALGAAVLTGLLLKARLDETRLRLELMTAQVEETTEAARRMAAQTDLLIEQMERALEDRAARDRAIVEETDQCLDERLPSGLLD